MFAIFCPSCATGIPSGHTANEPPPWGVGARCIALSAARLHGRKTLGAALSGRHPKARLSSKTNQRVGFHPLSGSQRAKPLGGVSQGLKPGRTASARLFCKNPHANYTGAGVRLQCACCVVLLPLARHPTAFRLYWAVLCRADLGTWFPLKNQTYKRALPPGGWSAVIAGTTGVPCPAGGKGVALAQWD